ncbi:MAG: DUF3027 domain-containing protein [Bifidobacterium sp.]|nr:DUF3027 domain-containing protein [Bifidobacterium sp.]
MTPHDSSAAQTTSDDTEQGPRSLARQAACETAENPGYVGDFAQCIELGEHVTDFRFEALNRGYEGWQWSVTLYHDVEIERWTVNETTLVPTDNALRPPQWVPWKERLRASDLAVTDSIGTDPDDPRLEDGFRKTEATRDDSTDSSTAMGMPDLSAEDDGVEIEAGTAGVANAETNEQASVEANDRAVLAVSSDVASPQEPGKSGELRETSESAPVEAGQANLHAGDAGQDAAQDIEDAVEEFDLSRRHVMSLLGRSQTAKRWYEGQHGPKSLSTKTAAGNVCSTCGFFIPLKGDLNVLFGVCANKWSPDDGRVVSIDHGCGEHSEIDPPEPSHLWVQSDAAYDDLHIDVVAHAPREERSEIELMELADQGTQEQRTPVENPQPESDQASAQ